MIEKETTIVNDTKSQTRRGKLDAKTQLSRGGNIETRIVVFTPGLLSAVISQFNNRNSIFVFKSTFTDGTPVNILVIFATDGFIQVAGHLYSALAQNADGSTHHNDLGTSQNGWRDCYLENPVTIVSDIRLKQNIKPLEYGLKDLLKIKPISFDKQGRRLLGFSAQELKKIIPEMVKGGADKDDTLSITTDSLIPILVNAIQELSARVDKLEKKK